MTTLKRTFYEMADLDPRLATIMFHAAVKRLGGTLRLSREELETYEGIETKILIEGTINEEEPNFGHVDWSAVLQEALQSAAALDRPGDYGMSFTRPPVNASRSAVQKFRMRLIAFLQEMPEGTTVDELLEELRGNQ